MEKILCERSALHGPLRGTVTVYLFAFSVFSQISCIQFPFFFPGFLHPAHFSFDVDS